MATADEEARNLADFQATNSRVVDVHSHVSGSQQKTWMRLLASVILNLPIKRQLDGKETNLGNEVAWLPTNFANVVKLLGQIGKDVAEVRELLKAIAAAQSVQYDPQAIAAATARELTGLIESVEEKTTTMTLREVPTPELPALEDLGEVK